MAVSSPRVRIKLEGDREAAAKLVPFAFHQRKILHELMGFQDLPQVTRTVTLEDGSIVICQSVYGDDTIRVYAPPVAVAEEEIEPKELFDPFIIVGVRGQSPNVNWPYYIQQTHIPFYVRISLKKDADGNREYEMSEAAENVEDLFPLGSSAIDFNISTFYADAIGTSYGNRPLQASLYPVESNWTFYPVYSCIYNSTPTEFACINPFGVYPPNLNAFIYAPEISEIHYPGLFFMGDITPKNNAIVSASIAGGGAGYVVGDILNILEDVNQTASVEVTAVDGTGGVISFDFISHGSDYDGGVPCDLTGGTGTGASVDGVLVSGVPGSCSGAYIDMGVTYCLNDSDSSPIAFAEKDSDSYSLSPTNFAYIGGGVASNDTTWRAETTSEEASGSCECQSYNIYGCGIGCALTPVSNPVKYIEAMTQVKTPYRAVNVISGQESVWSWVWGQFSYLQDWRRYYEFFASALPCPPNRDECYFTPTINSLQAAYYRQPTFNKAQQLDYKAGLIDGTEINCASFEAIVGIPAERAPENLYDGTEQFSLAPDYVSDGKKVIMPPDAGMVAERYRHTDPVEVEAHTFILNALNGYDEGFKLRIFHGVDTERPSEMTEIGGDSILSEIMPRVLAHYPSVDLKIIYSRYRPWIHMIATPKQV